MLHDQIAHVARLARLHPDPDQLARFGAQCSDIIGYVDLLSEVDTEGVAPLYSPIEDLNDPNAAPTLGGRPDVERPSPLRAEVLANAPASDGSFFVVPRIV